MLADSENAKQPATEEPERVRIIREVIDEIRPNLQRDGGDCTLVGVEGNKVLVRMTGACVLCKLASMTLEGIQSKLVERLGELVRLVPVPGAGGPGPTAPMSLQNMKPVRPVAPQRPE
jgi:Fe-S cluster biogenesis protein NfuA